MALHDPLGRRVRRRRGSVMSALDQLATIDADNLRRKVELIEEARNEGATWEDISHALNYANAASAKHWHTRHAPKVT